MRWRLLPCWRREACPSCGDWIFRYVLLLRVRERRAITPNGSLNGAESDYRPAALFCQMPCMYVCDMLMYVSLLCWYVAHLLQLLRRASVTVQSSS